MTNFNNLLNDFAHLMSGMSSVAGGMKSEVEQNMQNFFQQCALQAGFVRRDEFDNLSERFEQAVSRIKALEQQLSEKNHKDDTNKNSKKSS